VSHDVQSRFTMRDVVVMTGLADFTSAALTLQRARARAEELSRMKDEFLSMVSHELRTPLNSILGWSDVLLSGLATPDRAARAIEVIHANAARQAVLIEDLLDTSRIVSGSLRLADSAVDLAAVARSALSAVEATAAAKGVILRSRIEDEIPLFDGDADRLQQVVGNLLNNAVKFTPESGAVELSLRQTPTGIQLTVADNGIGIASDQLGSVFEPFRQLDASPTRRHSGLGLGLAIARRLAELHGGSIHAESAGMGQGSTFVVQLPAARIHATVTTLPSRGTSPLQDGSLAGLRILVVDDDADHRDLIVCALTDAGASTVCAASAAEALARLSEGRMDVLVSDLAMPDEDGCALIARVRAGSIEPTVPAIAVSAYAADADRRRALAAGFDRYVMKPIDLPVLRRTIREITAEWKAA
jgi:CheY-like chemotaxis protein